MKTRFSRPNELLRRWRRADGLGVTLLAGVLVAAALTTTACSTSSRSTSATTAPTASQSVAPSTTAQAATQSATPSSTPQPATKLEIKDLVLGKGATAKVGDQVTVDYTGWLLDGTKFDSSIDRKQPFPFVLGQGQVIEGWDKGFAGMKVGGIRQLIIPPQMAYGAQGAGGVIPPDATLKFEVKLLSVKPAGK